MAPVALVVLAAGQASRFGSPKQLARLNDGRSLLQRAIEIGVQASGDPVFVVLGAYHEQISPTLDHAEILFNPHWAEGMASSIACAVDEVKTREYAGVLFYLADQVALEPHDLTALTEAFSADHIVCADYNASTVGEPVPSKQKLGVPALFPRSCFSALQALSGDRGAKALLDGSVLPVHPIAMPVAAVDIDTPEALAAYTAAN